MSDIEVEDDPCAGSPTTNLGLRIGAIFIILVTSLFGTLFPIASKRIPFLRRSVPGVVFEFAKYFGSGVILATGFIHLLEPAADEELSEGNAVSAGGCISDKWGLYPFAYGICLASLFFTFVVHLIAFRIGTERLRKMGLGAGEHAPGHGAHSQAPSSTESSEQALEKGVAFDSSDSSMFADAQERSPLAAQILGVTTLEFGVIFHSIIIGLTLAVTGPDEFNILFIVIIFHQMFEGLGLGTRLAFLNLPPKYNFVPFVGAVVYSFVTPLGMAIGLGVRESLSMSSGSASVAAGVLDSISAGILIYTATVELLANEFLHNKTYLTCSWTKLWFAIVSFGLGTGIMALLGKWA